MQKLRLPLSILLLLICAQLFNACSSNTEAPFNGKWRFVIEMQNQELPFIAEVENGSDSSTKRVSIFNATDTLLIDDAKVKGDSLIIPLFIFDADIKVALTENGLEGTYEKPNRVLVVKAQRGNKRYLEEATNNANLAPQYDITFVHNQTDTTKAIGVFEQQQDGRVFGSILTKTGDYRFLEGVIVQKQLKLSTFDGAHAYVFEATIDGDKLVNGTFWSSSTWEESWTAVADENVRLEDAYSLTYLKEGYDRIDFSFPDLEGNLVSPTDPKYAGKVLILQLFGTWCPNCMDETRFLTQWYNANQDKDVEILAMAYELKDDYEYAVKRVKRVKEKMNVPYDFVIAGTSDKEEAAKTLPMLNQVISFPTMIIIDKNGDVAQIHTGFSGPGTGHFYTDFVQEFENTMSRLLAMD